MKKKNKLQAAFVLLCVWLCLPLTMTAQVTVGEDNPPQDFSLLEISTQTTKGGLRLPHLTTFQRDSITSHVSFTGTKAGLGEGLAIFNLDTKCVDYWNGTKWISLCSDGGSTPFEGGECAETPVSSTGGSVSCEVTDPSCTTAGAYTFTFVTGGDYASIVVTDAGAGKFTLTFEANDRASDRQAIVMATSPCGTSTLLVFAQEGDDTDCGSTSVPAIKSVGDVTAMCGSGAVYLYLTGYPATGTFIWTLNGQQVGTGNNYTATSPGKYIVYGDKVGCSGSQSIQVGLDGTGAPSPVSLIVIGNNGTACGVGGTVPLITSTPASGTVIWFCDGQLTSKTGTQIDAGKGNWVAVVKDGNCYSTPSAGVTVTEDTSVGTIPPPVIKINGMTSGWKLCRGGSVLLEVGAMEAGVTYTWYADNTQIGTGTGIYYPVPSTNQVVIRLRASGTGCAQESYTQETIHPDQAPGAPFISCNTPGNALCGGQATLSATGGTFYRWFKDGVEITGQTSATLVVTQTGSYTAVAVSAGGCQSVQSGAKVIVASDFATLSWVSHPAMANIGDTKTYSVSLDFPQNAAYTWTVTGGTITNGQGTASITVNFPAALPATVTCAASNACGTALGSPISQSVAVTTGCTDAYITSTSTLTPSIKVGNTATMSVTATGSDVAYQWYSGTVGSGTAIGGATAAGYEYTASATGTFNFYCVATPSGGCNAATSGQFVVTVKKDPGGYPSGTGNFTGKTCFDIAFSNDNSNSCGPISGRTSQKTNFGDQTTIQDPAGANAAVRPYSGVQVYTFKPSGTVSNVRFDYKDPSGKVIEAITGGNSGNSITGAVKATVYYKATLNTDLAGLTRPNALKAEIYAIYNDGASNNGTDKTVKLTATLMDCACCGAKTASGGWLNFMCHNLGADERLDPFKHDEGLYGDLYQWGRPTDGHEKRNSDRTFVLATTNTPPHGSFIGASSSPYDWRSGGENTSRWGDGTQDENPPKATNDPCPAGWKVPTQKQWTSIYTYATTPSSWVWTGYGFMVGDALYLPAAGRRDNSDGSLINVGSYGHYWSATVSLKLSRSMLFDSYPNFVNPGGSASRALGLSVRCVEDE